MRSPLRRAAPLAFFLLAGLSAGGLAAQEKPFAASGLVKWVMAAFDLHLPRTAAEQARQGIEVPRDTAQLLPGDLLFFGKGLRVTHVGIYVGEGKYIHAANRRKGVIESDVSPLTPRWWKGVH